MGRFDERYQEDPIAKYLSGAGEGLIKIGTQKSAERAALEKQQAEQQAINTRAQQENALKELLQGKHQEWLTHEHALDRETQLKIAQMAKQGMTANQIADNLRHETSTILNMGEKLGIGEARKKAAGISDVQSMIIDPTTHKPRMPTVQEMGQYQTAKARQRDVGALNEGDVGRGFLPTARLAAAKAAHWLQSVPVVGDFVPTIDPMSQGDLENEAAILERAKSVQEQAIQGARQEINRAAPTLAPTLHKMGRVTPMVESLGAGVEKRVAPLQQKQPGVPGVPSPEAIAAEIARRKSGR